LAEGLAALFGNAVASVPQKPNWSRSHSSFYKRARANCIFFPVDNTRTQLHDIMVRVKNRYLVVNFLYPEAVAKSKTQLPDLVQIHSPTPDAFHAGVMVRMIREEVEEMYGEYGMGMVSSGLKGG
jgi:hypothetical protein